MAVNGITSKIVIGAIVTTAIGTAGTGIIYNRNDAIKNFKEIRAEYKEGDEKVLLKLETKLEKLDETVTDMRLEQRALAVYIKDKL